MNSLTKPPDLVEETKEPRLSAGLSFLSQPLACSRPGGTRSELRRWWTSFVTLRRIMRNGVLQDGFLAPRGSSILCDCAYRDGQEFGRVAVGDRARARRTRGGGFGPAGVDPFAHAYEKPELHLTSTTPVMAGQGGAGLCAGKHMASAGRLAGNRHPDGQSPASFILTPMPARLRCRPARTSRAQSCSLMTAVACKIATARNTFHALFSGRRFSVRILQRVHLARSWPNSQKRSNEYC